MQAELTLHQIVEGISTPVAVLTPDGAVEFVNRQVLDYFGKTLAELKTWATTDAVHPDDLPGVIAVWSRSLESGQAYDIELRQRGADSVYRWFHVQGLPVRDTEGRIIRWKKSAKSLGNGAPGRTRTCDPRLEGARSDHSRPWPTPVKRGRLSRPWPFAASRGPLFRNRLQILANAQRQRRRASPG